MTYFGQKVRSCLTNKTDVELTLLKLYIRRALMEGLTVSYRDKIFVCPSMLTDKKKISIYRSGDPTSAIEVPFNRPADATDRFIDGFVFEVDANLDEVLFHHSNDLISPGNKWLQLKTGIVGLAALLGKETPVLTALLHKLSDA